jgi:hypothetical protein
MFRQRNLPWAPWAATIATFAFGAVIFESQSAVGGTCGAYCKARQVRAICHDTVKSKGLTGYPRDLEFEKCKVDPTTHKQLEELTDDTENATD